MDCSAVSFVVHRERHVLCSPCLLTSMESFTYQTVQRIVFVFKVETTILETFTFKTMYTESSGSKIAMNGLVVLKGCGKVMRVGK